VKSSFVLWPCIAGFVFLVAALVSLRAEIAAARGLDKLVVMGRAFIAASLAAFGAEHIAGASFIKTVVPIWMPMPLFWTYLVGVALLAVGLSVVVKKHVRLAGLMYAAMMFLFVILIHIHGISTHPQSRFFWAIGFRDFCFGAGGLALAATQTGWPRSPSSSTLILTARICIAIPLIFFAVEHILHPEFAPGVPLAKLTPDWVSLRVLLGYFTGVVLLVTGVCNLLNRGARATTTRLGLLLTLLTVVIYLPILIFATGASACLEGVNYVFDTLLFAGTILLLAEALPTGNPDPVAP
jgi:uncharacterized membrane protein